MRFKLFHRNDTKNRLKAKKVVIRLHEKIANRRENFLHQTSAQLVSVASLIATEDLDIKAMTANGGSYKAGLNRSILDTSPGEFFKHLEYKAAEAGIPYVLVPTRKVKPSQRCSDCDFVEKKHLAERQHQCKQCDLRLDRDVNAAIVMLKYAKKSRGQELALSAEKVKTPLPLKHETPPIIASAI